MKAIYMPITFVILLFLVWFLPTSHQCYAAELTGYAALDARYFTHPSQFPQQKRNTGVSPVLEPEWYKHSTDEKHTFTARPFLRFDSHDHKRTHADIRQLDWLCASDTWEIRTGFSKVFWGVTESRHLVDIINQTDGIEDVDEEDKLGQPMLQLAKITDKGTFRLFYLPYFRERTFASLKGRPRSALIVNQDRAFYANSNKRWHPDFALRYTHYIDDWDIGLGYFQGIGREPRIIVQNNEGIPFYQVIKQLSLDLQYTVEATLWKLETIRRKGQTKSFSAVVLGVEHTLYGIRDSDKDLGLLVEAHRDTRDTLAPLSAFDKNLFLGARLTFNDVQDTALLTGVILGLNPSSQSYLIELSRRITDHLKFEFDVRKFSNQPQRLQALNKDDFLQLRLAYYF